LITLSARASTFGGIVRPICLAALRFFVHIDGVRRKCQADSSIWQELSRNDFQRFSLIVQRYELVAS
jgi:hypothetical protein